MEIIQLAVLLAALLCSLVAGIVLTFAIVVMPGIKTLGDLAYLESFKAVDGVIQNNQPIFILVWLGSAVALLLATVLGIWQLAGLDRALLIAACAIYWFGVQLPTVAINIPLNNRLQSLSLGTLSAPELAQTRLGFEPRWVKWNNIRTVLALLVTVLLLALLMRF